MERREPATLDTNVMVYALSEDAKAPLAAEILQFCSFLSVQVLNEYANVAKRKLRRDWRTIMRDLDRIGGADPIVLPIDSVAHVDALRIAARYEVSFYDALMLAVALSGGAQTLYSEDMHHDLLVDGTLRIVNPFRPDAR